MLWLSFATRTNKFYCESGQNKYLNQLLKSLTSPRTDCMNQSSAWFPHKFALRLLWYHVRKKQFNRKKYRALYCDVLGDDTVSFTIHGVLAYISHRFYLLIFIVLRGVIYIAYLIQARFTGKSYTSVVWTTATAHNIIFCSSGSVPVRGTPGWCTLSFINT